METLGETDVKEPLVSILVPVYGVESFVGRCAESIFSQTYNNLEIIFVDDKTPDRSIDIITGVLENFPTRKNQTRVIHHLHNKGLSGSRNTALDAAGGEYILHVDADDYIERNTVALLVEKSKKDGSDMIIYDMCHVYPNKKISETFDLPSTKREIIKSLLNYGIPVGVCGKLIRRKLYTDYCVRAFEGINFGEDYAVIPRLAYNANKISHLAIPLYNYIHTNTSSYTESYKPTNIDDLLKVGELHKAYFLDKPEYCDLILYALTAIKIRLLIAIGLHPKSLGCKKNEVMRKWDTDNCDAVKELSLPYKVILILADFPLWIFSAYIKMSFKIKSLLK